MPSDTFVHYQADDLRGAYSVDLGRWSFTPNLDARVYYFDNTTIHGMPTSQRSRNRDVLSGGVTTHFSLSDQRTLLLVLQGANPHYFQPQPGQPRYNSTSFFALAGIDYEASAVWRYQLVGIEVRSFQSSQFSTHTGPIAEGSVIWTPTGLTTVTGLVSRTIEDTVAEGSRRVYLYACRAGHRPRIPTQRAAAGEGRHTIRHTCKGIPRKRALRWAGINWLINRNIRLSARL